MLHKTTAHYWGGGQDGHGCGGTEKWKENKIFKKESFPWGFSLSPTAWSYRHCGWEEQGTAKLGKRVFHNLWHQHWDKSS